MVTKATKSTKNKTIKTASVRSTRSTRSASSRASSAKSPRAAAKTTSSRKANKAAEQDYRVFILTMAAACLLIANAVIMVGIKVQNDALASAENAAHAVYYDGDILEDES